MTVPNVFHGPLRPFLMFLIALSLLRNGHNRVSWTTHHLLSEWEEWLPTTSAGSATTEEAYLQDVPLSSFHETTTTSDDDDNDKSDDHLPTLRLDWGNLPVLSPLARAMLAHQSNCSADLVEFRYRNRFGLGSDLTLWAMAVGNAMETGQRVVTHLPDWIYLDQQACHNRTMVGDESLSLFSAMTCYFGQAEMLCPERDAEILQTNKNSNNETQARPQPNLPKIYRQQGNISPASPSLQKQGYGTDDIFEAAMEVLFSHVTPLIVEEARRQVMQVFGPAGTPDNLITVHIRWGDKGAEMQLVPVENYIKAVQSLESKQNPSSHHNATTHVYLATEDPRAVQEFTAAAPSHWQVYVEPFLEQFKANRLQTYNGNPQMSRQLQGSPGRVAVASLLVALEAQSYVLTTKSNWSLLMNALRRRIVDPRRGPTRLVDLRPAPKK